MAHAGPRDKPRTPRRSYQSRRWHELLDELHALIKALEVGDELLDRASIPSRWDGFPASTLGAGGGGIDPNPFASRIAARVDYELGLPSDVGDGPRRDPDEDLIADAAKAMRSHVLMAIRALRDAEKARERGRAKLKPHTPAAAEAPGCVNCERYDVYSVAFKDGRCVPCYEYKKRSRAKGEGGGLGLDAPEHLVKTRPENGTRRSLAQRVDPTDVLAVASLEDASLKETLEVIQRRGAWQRGDSDPTQGARP